MGHRGSQFQNIPVEESFHWFQLKNQVLYDQLQYLLIWAITLGIWITVRNESQSVKGNFMKSAVNSDL